ncbi:cupin domain-containing protein [Longimicrobium sp.]|uniref:cupin domain-containing protein n=1 Tax=Longimicrobium sp. TaxID=2029185 RepID=UPI002E34F6D6|nr:cupin domain-containing protein [Longimicrobium sp.]HEX6041003.1 cupin domain-containing protein [Longimicrobium sp.]
MRSYLDGGLTVEVLGGDAAAGLFRAADARGGVAWLARGEAYAYLHAVEFSAPGDRRGFHVHAGHRERLYVFSGTLRLLAEAGGERVDLVLEAGSIVTFAPGVAHGFIAESPVFAVSVGNGTDPIHDSTPRPDLG